MRILIFLFALFICQFSWSQESPYQEKWAAVDSLELRGQVASALTIVDNIRATSKNNGGINYIKASIFRWKFLKINTEDAENHILREVNHAIDASTGREKAIFTTIKAKLLTDFMSNGRYGNKRSTGQEKSDDITTWNQQQLVTEIHKAYQEVLSGKEMLLQTPASEISDLLHTSLVTRMYKPTLYDVIAQEAMGFFNANFYGITRPNVLFEVDNPAIFEDSETFRAWRFTTKDSLASKFNAVRLLQDIEEVHSKDSDKTAYVFAQLERLQFARRYYAKSGKDDLYEEALVLLSRKHKNNPIYALLQYALASCYVDRAPKSLSKTIDHKEATYYNKAETICETIISQNPNSEASIKATQLLVEIRAASLALKTKRHVLPGVENRLFATYRNLDSMRIRVMRLPADMVKGNEYNQQSKILELLQRESSGIIVEDKIIALPNASDRNYHTAAFLLPPLEHGYYDIFIDNTRLEKSKSFAHTRVEVSDFGRTKTDYTDKIIYQWYDRITGQPIQDLKVTITGKGAASNSGGVTNALGEYIMRKPPESRKHRSSRLQVTAVRNGDSLFFNDYLYEHYRSASGQKEPRAKTEIFLDRAIYRPGQTLFFKGILLQELNKKSQVVPNEKVVVYIEDTNYEEIFKSEFTTNEYGSFSGEFTVPENVLTGQFSIYTEESDADSDFWDDLYTYQDGQKQFKVEAYKRPTFEITFDAVETAYKPNDSITVTGNAKAFLGSNVTEAEGIYTIKRSKFNRYWYYYGNNNDGRQIDQGTFTTDDKGNFSITFKADYEDQSLESILEFNVEVDITDINGETRDESLRVKVGKNNLYATLTEIKQVNGGQDLVLEVANKNLNDNPVSCTNQLRIFKIQAPDRVMFDRLWETPEYQTISQEDFNRAFPNEPYRTDSIQKSHTKKMYEGSFENKATYTATIPTDVSWEAGEYVIEHIAQGENDTAITTTQSFTVVQPKNTYLPADQLFSYEIENDPQKDRFVLLKLKTSLKNLPVFVYGFYKNDRFFKEKLDVNGNTSIKINLDPAYDDEVVVRLKYAQFDRVFSEDIRIDVSAPQEFLQIETQSFRSTLNPDSKEKWSFKITNENNKKTQAEVLASMYDLSLDTFAKDYWNPDIAFKQYNYEGVPRLENQQDYVANFRVNLGERRSQRYSSSFERLNYYGLTLAKYDGAYPKYLRFLKSKRALNQENNSSGTVVGVVLEENGPLPGASVLIKGTAIGTQTDFDGEFAINASPNDILVISYVGYETMEVAVGNGTIYATLAASEDLDEVVVIGYGVKREKKALGYAVSSVIADDLNSMSEADVARVLSGKASGVNITSSKSKAELQNIADSKKINFKKVKIRKNLEETAFFFPHLTTNKKGEVKFTFDAPQLLTQWKFRLFAHSKNLRTAGLEKEVITQKDLSLVPNAPRFLREGDAVALSAKIANLTANAITGAAQLQLFDAISMQPVDSVMDNIQATQSFEIDAYGNASVFWNIKIPAGMQAVTYRMVAKAGKFSDGEENVLPVLPNRLMVTETVPFLVRAGQEKEVSMKHLLENTSTSLVHQQFAFEYTSNPSWYALQSLPYLMEFPHECAEQTFSRLYANSLSAKVLNSNPKIKEIFNTWKGDGVLTSALEKNEDLKNILIAETPWLRNAQSETERKKRLGLLFDLEKNAFAKANALKKLRQIQNANGGFPWFSGGRSSSYITRHIVAGFGHMQRLGIAIEDVKLLENAIDFLDIEIENELAKYLKNGGKEEDFYKRRANLHFLYARSFFEKEYPLLGKVKQIGEKTQQYYTKNWLDKSIYEKGLLALVNQRRGNSNAAKTILTGLKESAVQSPVNGMYWKQNRSGWYWYQAPIETHAMIIEAFEEILDDPKSVEELKIWLLQQKRTSDWDTTKATAAATYALLMSGTKFTDLDDSVEFTMPTPQAQQKIDATSREVGTGYIKTTWSVAEISKDVAKLTINNTGTTVGYGGMYWQYFEDLDKIEKGEEQILNLNKKLFLVNNQDATAPLEEITSETALDLGETVRVQLTIKTLSNMEFVHLKDMRASGLEPVDVLSKHTYQDGISYYQSTRDVATHFFFDAVPQGTYVIEYDMRVNNKGSFSNGISTIQSMYVPEFSGNTAGMKIIVD